MSTMGSPDVVFWPDTWLGWVALVASVVSTITLGCKLLQFQGDLDRRIDQVEHDMKLVRQLHEIELRNTALRQQNGALQNAARQGSALPDATTRTIFGPGYTTYFEVGWDEHDVPSRQDAPSATAGVPDEGTAQPAEEQDDPEVIRQRHERTHEIELAEWDLKFTEALLKRPK